MTRLFIRSACTSALAALLSATAGTTTGLIAQSGQVEVWIPLTTRAIVVDALTHRLTSERWSVAGVSDYGARFERPSTPVRDAMGAPVGEATIDRLKITFRDLADTLRVAGSITTVFHPNTATERSANRDDAAAMREIGELLAGLKMATQNRRTAAESVAPAESPPREPVPVRSMGSSLRVGLRLGEVVF